MTFNNILRKIWGLPRQCHTSLLHLTAAVDSVFNTVYNRSLRLVSSAINSDSIILHDVQCSRASQPTFKNPHRELPELQNSVLCIPLTVLSEKEVI